MLQRTRGLVPDVQSGFAPRCFGGNAGQGYAAFYGGNDIRQGNGVGAARQNMAASYAPKTLHYSLGLQQAHNFLHKFFRNAGTGRQLRSGSRDGVTLFRKAQQQVQGMTGHSGNAHDNSLNLLL